MEGSKEGLTTEIVTFVQELTYEQIPPNVRIELKRCLLDGLGVILSGVNSSCSQIIRTFIRETANQGTASILGTNITSPTTLAALANGLAGHAEDFDDTQLSTSPDRIYGLLTHPTTPALAATLAVAEEVDANGKEFLTAFCAGFEVECKIADTINPNHYVLGNHSTGTIGIFAAATGAAKLLRLTKQETANAIGIAASKSAGIRANFGTMTKPYHAGAAAENGIISAKLAQLGYVADPNSLDGPWGFFQVKGGACDPNRLLGKLGNPYTLEHPGVSVKPYPCGSLSHPSMDALLDLINEHDIKPHEVDTVQLRAGNNILLPLRYTNPQNELEAKFSLQFCLAILLLRRQAGLKEFKDEVIQDPVVYEMMTRIHTYHDKSIEAQGSTRMLSVVKVQMKNGEIFQKEASTSRGQPDRPMDKLELESKFINCAEGILDQKGIEEAIQTISRVDTLNNISEIIDKLTILN